LRSFTVFSAISYQSSQFDELFTEMYTESEISVRAQIQSKMFKTQIDFGIKYDTELRSTTFELHVFLSIYILHIFIVRLMKKRP